MENIFKLLDKQLIEFKQDAVNEYKDKLLVQNDNSFTSLSIEIAERDMEVVFNIGFSINGDRITTTLLVEKVHVAELPLDRIKGMIVDKTCIAIAKTFVEKIQIKGLPELLKDYRK